MQEELVDRFGDLPEEARALLESHRLRVIGKPLGVARLDATPETIQLQFIADPPLDAARSSGWSRPSAAGASPGRAKSASSASHRTCPNARARCAR